jgi:hypothetical protein
MDKQVQRRFYIKACTRQTNATLAHIRNVFGFWTGDGEKARAEAVRKSRAVRKAILDGKTPADPDQQKLASDCEDAVLSSHAAMAGMQRSREFLEEEMQELGRLLPCQRLAEDIRGFSVMRLAVLIGEAGDLGNYPSPAKLWKRFGVAPDAEYAMETKGGKTAIAKPRRRRSELWVVGDAIIKAQVRKIVDDEGKDTGGRMSNGALGGVYLRRKEYERPRVETDLHARRRAQRYMEKRLLRDLWIAWNEETGHQDTSLVWRGESD